MDPSFSRHYQWLPAEFQILEDGKVKILSYITGLHPKFNSLYGDIEQIFERMVPIFESTIGNIMKPFPMKTDKRNPRYEGVDWNQLIVPKITRFEPPMPQEKMRFRLKGRRLQVIVKVASIELTPASPQYPGGVWHVEGMKNESIVATGIYYYSQENITKLFNLLRSIIFVQSC